MIAAPLNTLAKIAGSASALCNRVRRLPQRLARDRSGVAFVEFAFTAPIVLSMGMLGTETAYYVITHMQVSQLAMQVADNVSRVGEQDVLVARRVFESDINASLVGAEKLGETFQIFERGRVIISSLQRNADDGQWIAWQRCRGARVHNSRYGNQGDGATGTAFQGMGKPGQLITAANGTAVIFIEISYEYDSLTPFTVYDGQEITYTAAFNVRDNRNLAGLFQRDPNDPDPVASCNVYSADRPV
ncbi:TadE/TadG family type IV pilus assembly protein [Erythrobacter sp.]|uniref:TadE/TadG family type IV pilus assembly protein n=1 Tax=Erythrobacter sp. TaxID=1042 RepID=UPI0025F4A2DE|nr:TadE/TadG family type IV pilus assembly protein [Erythrobacter sp.]